MTRARYHSPQADADRAAAEALTAALSKLRLYGCHVRPEDQNRPTGRVLVLLSAAHAQRVAQLLSREDAKT